MGKLECWLIGRLGHDVTVRYTANQKPVVNLSVCEDRRRKDGDMWYPVPVWHRLTAWNNLAERASRILRKGSLGIFRFRIDYRPVVVLDDNKQRDITMPVLMLVDFEPLADFGNRKES